MHVGVCVCLGVHVFNITVINNIQALKGDPGQSVLMLCDYYYYYFIIIINSV